MQEVAQRGVALAQGPLHAVRRTSEHEKLLKNAKAEYAAEAEEIANYTAIETIAADVGDSETARLARGIRRQEERMASFLERLISQLAKAVVQAEIPASQRDSARRRKPAARRTSPQRNAPRRNSLRRRHPARQSPGGAEAVSSSQSPAGAQAETDRQSPAGAPAEVAP
jgi:hypothetical protein